MISSVSAERGEVVQESFEALLTDRIMIPSKKAFIKIQTHTIIYLMIIPVGQVQHLYEVQHIVHRDSIIYLSVSCDFSALQDSLSQPERVMGQD